MPNKINAKKINTSVPKVKRPTCPKHRLEMSFDTARSCWSCRMEGCKIVARHKDGASAPSATPARPPHKNVQPTWMRLEVGQGADEEPTYTLFVSDRNTTYAIDVTDYTEMVIDDAGGQATLCLVISDVSP